MKLAEQSCSAFAELAASAAPTPGGGGVSALAAAVGTALNEMVGQLTVGKKKYESIEAEMKRKMERCAQLRKRLLKLVDEDAENFEPLAAAYAIPRDEPGREEKLEECLLLAVKGPQEIFALCCESIDMASYFAENGSRIMVSDAATAAAILRGALLGAAVNIKVNTKLMKNRPLASSIDRDVNDKLKRYTDLADSIFYEIYRTY